MSTRRSCTRSSTANNPCSSLPEGRPPASGGFRLAYQRSDQMRYGITLRYAISPQASRAAALYALAASSSILKRPKCSLGVRRPGAASVAVRDPCLSPFTPLLVTPSVSVRCDTGHVNERVDGGAGRAKPPCQKSRETPDALPTPSCLNDNGKAGGPNDAVASIHQGPRDNYQGCATPVHDRTLLPLPVFVGSEPLSQWRAWGVTSEPSKEPEPSLDQDLSWGVRGCRPQGCRPYLSGAQLPTTPGGTGDGGTPGPHERDPPDVAPGGSRSFSHRAR